MRKVSVRKYPDIPDGVKLPIIYFDRFKGGFIKALIQFLPTTVSIFDESCNTGSLRMGSTYENIPNCTIIHKDFIMPEDDE